MALRDLITFNRAVGGIRDSMQNISSIRAARQKIDQERQIFDIKKKQANLELQEKELTMPVTQAQAKAQKMYFDDLFKQQDIILKGKEAQSDSALDGEEQKYGELFGIAERAYNNSDPNIATLFDPMTGRISTRSNKTTTSSVDKVMGEIDLGSKLEDGEEMPFESREEVEKHATRQLGYGWKTKYPQAVQLIDSKFPKEPPLDMTQAVRVGAKAALGNKVKVEFNGQTGIISRENLDEAIKRGAKIVK